VGEVDEQADLVPGNLEVVQQLSFAYLAQRFYDANDLVVGVEFLNISNRASKEQLGSIQFQLA
jgi:hypothetical protein